MAQIVLSIPLSLIVFKLFLGIEYFCALHIFVVIVILGIGADDVFVFDDMWKHTSRIKILRKRTPLRLAYTFRKAASAMFVTSLTTAISFGATCISPIMPMVSFGLYAAIVVSINYGLILIFLPSIYILYDFHIRPCCGCCLALKRCLKKRCKRSGI